MVLNFPSPLDKEPQRAQISNKKEQQAALFIIVVIIISREVKEHPDSAD